MPENEPKKIYCNRCQRETNHTLRGDYSSTYVDEEDGLWEETENSYLYSCAGCEAPTLLVAYSNAGGYRDRTLYPKRTSDERIRKKFSKLTPKLNQVYGETVDAYNNHSLLLCTIGLRTLLEGICEDKKAKGKDLQHKINSLAVHFPTGNLITYLHSFRFSGNEAAHQLEPLTSREAADALEVMEDLLNFLYDLDYKASRLKHANKASTSAESSTAARNAIKPDSKEPERT